jgi:hypothetical protein
VISTCPALGLRAWLVVWGDVLAALVTGMAAADQQVKGGLGWTHLAPISTQEVRRNLS